MPRPRRRPPAATMLVVVVATLAGCGGGDDGGAARPTQPVRPPTTDDSTTTTTADAPTTTAAPDLDAVAITLTVVADGLDSPIAAVAGPGGDGWFVAEQSGRLRRVRDGAVEPEPVLDFSDTVSTGNEQGLLGVALSPDGERIYVDYTDRAGHTHVAEYPVAGDGSVDAGAARELLVVEQPFANHNGGHLTFGPDGLLYIGLGDGGSAGDPQGNAQDTATLLGSILRIDPRASDGRPYSVPGDNPFVDDADARPEIFQYGLRNPWRFSFDRATGDLWIGDVGQGAREEIDYAAAGDQHGVNWGWNAREGTVEFAGPPPADAREPLLDYGRDEGLSVTGGFVYRGDAVPALRGVYVYADFGAGDLIGVVQRDGQLVDRRPLGANAGNVTSFAEDAAGELHVLDRAGRILRVDPA